MKKNIKILLSFVVIMIISSLALNVNAQNKGKEESKEIIAYVEQPAQFPGGIEKLMTYIENNVNYPERAKNANIEGVVTVSFVVDKDGSITDVKSTKDIGGGCADEAIRVVKSMPKWAPAKHKGKPVKQMFKLPVNFAL